MLMQLCKDNDERIKEYNTTTRRKIKQVQKDDKTPKYFIDLTSEQEKGSKQIVQEKIMMV